MAIARVCSFMVYNLDPSYTQLLLSIMLESSVKPNLAIGTFYPVKLDSSTNNYPFTIIESQGISSVGW